MNEVLGNRRSSRAFESSVAAPHAADPFDLDAPVNELATVVLQYADAQRHAGCSRIDLRTVLRDALNVDPQTLGISVGVIARDVSRVLALNGWMRCAAKGRGGARIVEFEYSRESLPNPVLQEPQFDTGTPGT